MFQFWAGRCQDDIQKFFQFVDSAFPEEVGV